MNISEYISENPLKVGQTIFYKKDGIVRKLLVGDITQDFGCPGFDGGVGFETIGNYEVVLEDEVTFLDKEIISLTEKFVLNQEQLEAVKSMVFNIAIAAMHDSRIRKELFKQLE
jgi:hypothetical protein